MNNQVSENPILVDAKALLKELAIIGGRPIIAGGALRDLTLGRTVKDVDIIVKDSPALKGTIEKAGKGLGYTFTSKTDASGASGYNDSTQPANTFSTQTDIVEVFVLEKAGKPSIDFIVVSNEPVVRVKYFPCNGSMIWMDVAGQVHTRMEFSFFKHGLLMFFPTATREYTSRMLSYFPTHFVTVNLGDLQIDNQALQAIPF